MDNGVGVRNHRGQSNTLEAHCYIENRRMPKGTAQESCIRTRLHQARKRGNWWLPHKKQVRIKALFVGIPPR